MKRLCQGLLFAAVALLLPAAAPAQEQHLKMALVNIRSVFTDGPDAAANQKNLQANLQRHFYFIERLAADGADFIGFPELSLNGYHFSKNMTWLKLDSPEIKALQQKAIDRKVYISVGLALEDEDGKRYNVQIVIDPQGRIVGLHRKIWLTAEKGYTEAGGAHNVFDVKGLKVGIAICADGTDRKNLEALVKNGAQLIYGPHANTTGGTSAGWYKFRAPWGGPGGWIAELKVYAALHNNAGLFSSDHDPPAANTGNSGFASGAWFIGPDGRTLAQMPASAQRTDSKEHVLIYSIPLPGR
jgi:predicted amidohydrolase